jgi:isochorismate hydrolase
MKELYFTDNNIGIEASDIYDSIKKYSRHIDWKPDISQSALIVLDMQKYFFDPSSHAFIPSAMAIIKNVVYLCDLFSKQNRPMIFTAHIDNPEESPLFNHWWKGRIEQSSEQASIIHQLIGFKHHPVIKNNYDAFLGTNLEEVLKNYKVKDLIITGVMTHLCCDTTIRSAFMKNFRCFFPVDATADYNRLFHLSGFINLSHGYTVPMLTKQILSLFQNY